MQESAPLSRKVQGNWILASIQWPAPYRNGANEFVLLDAADADEAATIVTPDDPQHGVIDGPCAIPEDHSIVLVDRVESLQ